MENQTDHADVIKNEIDSVTENEESKTHPAHDSNIPLSGSIDAVEAGIVHGWAAYQGDNGPVSIHIIHEGKIIGTGVADTYREDLKAAGINQGNHGFSIEIERIVPNGWNGDKLDIEIFLVDANSLVNSNINKVVTLLDEKIYATFVREEHGHLYIEVSSDSALGKKHVVLYKEDKKIHAIELDTNKKNEILQFPLPVSCLDGKPHLYKVGILGVDYILASNIVTVNPIQTPWQYLKDSYHKPGFLSMSRQADGRYESLHYQMDAISNSKSHFSVADVMTLHNIVVEGYEGRTRFPKISLPKFNEPKVSIIVPAYNKFELTYHCIASIALAFNETSYEVILADDCSTDETVEAESIISNLVVSRNPENLRFLRSCNRATEIAKGDYLLFLNNDTEVTSFWLDELVNKMESDSQIGMTGSKLLNLDGSLQEAGGIVWGNGKPWNVGRNANPLAPEYSYAREVDYLTGAAMCIRKTLWEEVGRFSEELVPCYYEDTDLAFKVREAGFKTVYVPHSVVVHFEGQSHGTDITKGLKRYQVVNEKTFQEKWYGAFRNKVKPSLENLKTEKDRNIEQRVLVIDYASPMPNKDAGSYAAIQEMKLIQSLGFKVTFVPANLAHFGKYTRDLQKLGIEVLYAPFYQNLDHVLDTRLAEMDAVYITRYHIAQICLPKIRALSDAKVIFNNADLHFLREMRAAVRYGKDEAQLTKALKTREEELAVCEAADAVLCYNATEHAVITSHIGKEADKLHITPWLLEEKPKGPAFSERKGISFLGGFNHLPNGEAVKYLVEDIMPLLQKQRPDIVLYVYGSNMPVEYKEWETDNIKMVGFAETLDGVYHDHRVFVAPLLSGAGIKGKVLESMAYNLPTVLSDVAAEGTGLMDEVNTLIAKTPEEWVASIIRLYDDKSLWNKFAENSQALVETKYSFEHGHKAMKDIFASVGVYSSK